MRLIFYILLIFGIYYLFKNIFKSPSSKKKRSNLPWQIEDELVKDPMCGIYIPKSKAIKARVNGQIHYFCSKECKKSYIKQLKEGKK
ncbi:MAG: hypothetical protein J7M03_06730 [Candidatus Desulfofervidaceae bacterium]|nr:hypothetical protein [Candidatus Desulfofervidaceae bacterium]